MSTPDDVIVVVQTPAVDATAPEHDTRGFSDIARDLAGANSRVALIVLIGPLTKSGSLEDFRLLDDLVTDLVIACAVDDFPTVLAVPGPSDGRPLSRLMARALGPDWAEMEKSFWSGEEPEILSGVSEALGSFAQWISAQSVPSDWRHGVLPGDGWGHVRIGDTNVRVATVNTGFRLLNRSLTPQEAVSGPEQWRSMGLDLDEPEPTLVISPLTADLGLGSDRPVLLAGGVGAGSGADWKVPPAEARYLVLRSVPRAGGLSLSPAVPSRPELISAPGGPTVRSARRAVESPSTAERDDNDAAREMNEALASGRLILVITSGIESGSLGAWGAPLDDPDRFKKLLAEQLGVAGNVPLVELVARMQTDKQHVLRNSVEGLLRDTGEKPNHLAQSILKAPWFRVYDFTGTDILDHAVLPSFNGGGRREIVHAREQPHTPTSGKLEIVLMNGGMGGRNQYEIDFTIEANGTHPRAMWFQQFRADLTTNPVLFIANSITSEHLWRYLELIPNNLRPKFFVVAPDSDDDASFRLRGFNTRQIRATAEEFAGTHLKAGLEPYEKGARVLARLRSNQTDGSGIQLADVLLRTAGPGNTQFLRGQDPSWNEINEGIPARLSTVDEMWEKYRSAGSRRPIMILADRSGTGKTTNLMQFGKELNYQNHVVGWLDRYATHNLGSIVKSAGDMDLDAILVDDIDIFGARATDLLRQLNRGGKTLVVATIRTTRSEVLQADNFISINPLRLTGADLEALVNALDRGRELGELKKLLQPSQRIERLRQVSEQDLMLAMHEVVYGYQLAKRVEQEFDQLVLNLKPGTLPALMAERLQRVYATVCLFYALQYEDRKDTLSENALVQIGSEGIPDPLTTKAITDLLGRRLLVQGREGQIHPRHKVVAEKIHESRLLPDSTRYRDLLRDLLLYYVKTAAHIKDPNNPHRRVMIRLLNHRIMVKSGLTKDHVRSIYNDLHDWLRDDFHYWLQCGSYELESGDLDTAASYLKSAQGCPGGDTHFKVVTTWGLVCFRQAIRNPSNIRYQREARASVDALQDVIKTVGTESPHTFAFLAGEAVDWLDRTTLLDAVQKRAVAREISKSVELGKRLLPRNENFQNAAEDFRTTLARLLDDAEDAPRLPL